MALIVQKYGGSSLESADRIRAVAERIVATKKQGNDVVVVCSAMGDTTDELLDLAAQVNPVPPRREMDMLLTAGERISNALVAMAVESLGAHAQSFTGSQAGVLTTERHGNARIVDVTPGRLTEALDEGKICIVAGFQGVNKESRDVTTLGRGGSDTTAVAVADPDMATRPALDFEAGYVQRALGELPRQGEADDWRMSMSYFEDAKRLNSELSFGEESGLRLSSSKHAKVTV